MKAMKAALGSVGGKKERQQQQQRQQQQLQQLQHQQQQEAAAAAVLEAPSPSLSPPLPPTVLLHSMPLSVPMTMEEGKGEGVGEEQQQQHQGGIQVDVVEEVEQQQSPLLSTPLPPPPLVAPPPLVSASGESKRGDRREDEEEIWSGGSEEEPYFTFSPSSLPPECYDTVDGGRAGSSCPSWVGSSTTYDPAQPFAPYGIAERIASFLSVKDIAAYLALDEKAQWGYESYTTIRDILDYLLGSLSLLRLLEWGLGTAGRLAHGSVMLVVTCVRGVGNGIHAVYAHIMATLSYFLRLGLALWRELRSLSLRELVRALLLLLTDKLERDVTGRESSSMGSRSSSHHGLGLGSSTSTLDRAPSSSFRRSSSLFPSVMCTPQSFPPTPISRACVMARFSQFSDDIVYLARDQLRLEELVKADDDVTKMAAQSLKQQACLASRPPSKFSVNGMPVLLDATDGHPGGDVTPLFIPKDDDIYPTLTLHSPSTQVLGRFCAADILHPHRSLVGAPLGVPVYALDGSVILKPDQDVGTSNI
ncbi:Hypothetical protein NocV09_00700240 [Nannochloropsis oceanica]